ncbi:hypothetical protein D1BOALGB6SA_1772 [Olavius sp. associated proteobacterium Delta 1]|nr:hypothetical protein D1BOALGB6SA_1772 [Olavius sp. associated proteobacterium Delta 1]
MVVNPFAGVDSGWQDLAFNFIKFFSILPMNIMYHDKSKIRFPSVNIL